jgi:hypothetical protein
MVQAAALDLLSFNLQHNLMFTLLPLAAQKILISLNH